MRRNRELLEQGGGRIEFLVEELPHGAALEALYLETERRHLEAGSLAHPVRPTAALLSDLASLPADRRAIVTVRVGDELVAFILALRTGDRLLLRTCGVDAERSRPIYGYMNLMDGAVELARRWGCQRVDLGPTLDHFKRQIGAAPEPIAYLADFRSLLLRPVGWAVARRFRTESST